MASPQSPIPSKWANRAGREFDIVVFGASGFTGRFVLIEAMRVARSIVSGTPLPPHAPLRVAAAGRSRARVEQAVAAAEASVRKEAGGSAGPAASAGAAEQGEAGRGGVTIVVADVCDSASLAAMARRCCVLINCVGPFRFYGAPVVEACVAAGTDYVDVCGEPEFMERMAFAHHAAAVKAGCLVVSACGFDSVPADLGTQYTLRQLSSERAAAVAVDSYLSVSAPRGLAGHYATWESLVHGLASAGELRAIRREAAKSAAGGTRKPSSGNSSSSSSSERPFMGADASVVRRSLAAFQAAAAAQAAAGAGAGAGAGVQGDVGASAGGEDASGGQGETDALLASPSSPPPESSASAAVAAAAGAAASGAAVSMVQGTGLEALPVPCNAAAMVHYSAYFTVSSSFHVCLFLAFGALLKALTAVPFGIKLLLKYPSLFSFGVFSHQADNPLPGPSESRPRIVMPDPADNTPIPEPFKEWTSLAVKGFRDDFKNFLKAKSKFKKMKELDRQVVVLHSIGTKAVEFQAKFASVKEKSAASVAEILLANQKRLQADFIASKALEIEEIQDVVDLHVVALASKMEEYIKSLSADPDLVVFDAAKERYRLLKGRCIEKANSDIVAAKDEIVIRELDRQNKAAAE
ncbi:unnamed protein product [Closterium sp. Naga37s-1]|nr:unnamed protein product [Closterium sp. Naga37s-1]